MNYAEINAITAKKLSKTRQASVFANNWEESAKLIASLAIPKSAIEDLPVEADEESFIAKSALLPKLIEQVTLDDLSISDLVLMGQAAKAIEEGDTKAATFFRDTAGGKPVDKVEQKSTNIAELPDDVVDYLLNNAKIDE